MLTLKRTFWNTRFRSCCFCFIVGLASVLMPARCFSFVTLDYDSTVEKALGNSHDVKMSRLDIGISESVRKRAYSLYYPIIRAQWNTEYVRDLSDGSYQLTTIGNMVLVQNTMYQSSLLLAGTYNLYDFGATSKRVSIAKSDVNVKKTTYKQTVRDVKIKVLGFYADLLSTSRELEVKKQLLTLYKELSLTKERFYKAGRISKIEMVDESVKAVRIIDEIDTLKLKVKKLYQDLSFFTGEQYEADTIRVSDLSDPGIKEAEDFNVDRTLESRIYALEIEKKEAELKALQSERYPRINLYSNYVWYANHNNEPETSAGYIKPRNFFVGLSATINIFEGFKSNADIDRAKLEVERLKVERSRKLSELSARHAKLSESRKTYALGVKNQKEMLKKVEAKLKMIERMSEQKLLDRTEFINQKIELLSRKLELTKVIIARTAAVKELEVLSGTGE